MGDDPVEGMARVGWASIYEMIDAHREHAAKTDDPEIAAMLLKDAAVYEADVLKRARAAWAYARARLFEPSEAMLRAGAESIDALDYPATEGDTMFVVECTAGLYGPEALVAWRAMWAAFARTHGLEPPGGQGSAPGAEGSEMPSRPESATSGAVRGATGPFEGSALPPG